MGRDNIHKKVKILIGSNGGLTGIYLAKELRKMDDVILYGADSSDICTGKFFVDEQIQWSDAGDPGFIKTLVDVLSRKGIDVYLPTHSNEIKAVSIDEPKIRRSTETKFIVSPYRTFEALDDKVTANQNLREIGIPVPALIEGLSGDGSDYPIFMKQRVGSGGRETMRIDNPVIHKAYLDTYNDMSFFQLIQGSEYTVDCMFDKNGDLLGYNQRRRLKMIGGAATITQNDHLFDIGPWIKKIAGHWMFRGCVNFQYIVKDGIPYFIDVNLRYPSGGLPLTVRSGIDIPKLTVDMLLGRPFVPVDLRQKRGPNVMYRYYEEIFE